MNWYVAPVCTVDPESGPHPGEGAGSTCPGVILGIIIQAYDPDPTVLVSDPDPTIVGDEIYQVPTTCLVGSNNDESLRPGWLPKTLPEAEAHFLGIVGRAPTGLEVF